MVRAYAGLTFQSDRLHGGPWNPADGPDGVRRAGARGCTRSSDKPYKLHVNLVRYMCSMQRQTYLPINTNLLFMRYPVRMRWGSKSTVIAATRGSTKGISSFWSNSS